MGHTMLTMTNTFCLHFYFKSIFVFKISWSISIYTILKIDLFKDENLNGKPVAYCLLRNETDINLEFMYDNILKL